MQRNCAPTNTPLTTYWAWFWNDNWDKWCENAGPRYGLLAQTRTWRVWLYEEEPKAHENRAIYVARPDEGGRLYICPRVALHGVEAAFYRKLIDMGKKAGLRRYGGKLYLYHLSFALEGGIMPQNGAKLYERHHKNGNRNDDRAANIALVDQASHSAFTQVANHKPKALPSSFTAFVVVEARGAAGWGINGRKTVGPADVARMLGWCGNRPRKAAQMLAIAASWEPEGCTRQQWLSAAVAHGIGAKNAEKLLTGLTAGKVQLLQRVERGRYRLTPSAYKG